MTLKKHLILLCFALLPAITFTVTSYAQPGWRWGKTSADVGEGWPVTTDKNSNVFASGEFDYLDSAASFGSITLPIPSSGEQSVWVKYKPDGTVLWAGGTDYTFVRIFDITTDTAGNLILFGSFNGDSVRFGTLTLYNTTGTFNQFFIVKLNPAGSVLWGVNDGALSTVPSGLFYLGRLRQGGVATDDSGNIYITGAFKQATLNIGTYHLTNADASGTTTDIFVAKYTPTGVLAWAASAGGTANDVALGITATTAGAYITGGYNSLTLTFGSAALSNTYASPRAFIAQYSATGTPLWAQAAGGPSGATGADVTHDDAGNIYMTGSFADAAVVFGTDTFTESPGGLTPSTFLVKCSPTGAVAWGRTITSLAAATMPYTMSYSACGQVWVGGRSAGQVVVGTGDTLSLPMATDPVFIAGFDVSGSVVGAAGLLSGGDDDAGIACDALGNVYVCGDFEPMSFIIGPDTLGHDGSITEQYYLAKYGNAPDTVHIATSASICGQDSVTLTAPPGTYYAWDNGELTQTRRVHDTGSYTVLITVCGDTVTADTFHVSLRPPAAITPPLWGVICPFGVNQFTDSVSGGVWSSSAPAVATIEAGTGIAHFVSIGLVTITYTLGACSVTLADGTSGCEGGVHAVTVNDMLRIIPNPATTLLTIQSAGNTYGQCSIINNIGQVLLSLPLTPPQTEVNIASLPPGIYYVRITSTDFVQEERFVKE